ncbi:MAG: hypothetical protein NC033_00090 [Clostridiales bacterium]|nr:hypothetical protein [Clostridiales bacterium]
MKKWKIVLAAILASVAAVACGTAVGCKKHTHDAHTYSSAWSKDRYTHWHEPTCNDTDERGDEDGHTWGADNKCTVCDMVRANGIEVKKTVTKYSMDTNRTISIPVNDLSVNLLKEDGSVDRAMSANEYTVSYYKGKEQLTDLSAVDEGSYNIWVEANINNQIVDSCVVVYVTDIFADFRMVEGEVEQVIGGDHISQTWKFEAQLLSGNKIDLGISDVQVAGFSTFEVADDHKATVTYEYVDSTGKSTLKTTDVPYVITEPEGNVSLIKNDFAYSAITGITGDKTQLKNENMTGANSFITVTDIADFQWRSSSYVEIRGNSLEIEFNGTGVFKIGCATTSSSNVTGLALMDEDGNYVTATYSSDKVIPAAENAIYAINGNVCVDFSFTINKPGKYTVCGIDEIQTAEDLISTKSYLRIWTMSMIDIVISE